MRTPFVETQNFASLHTKHDINTNENKMTENKFKNNYRIPSARAAWYNYNGGMYFITICTKNREHYFGEIVYDENNEAKMNYTELGKIAIECWKSIPLHFPHTEAPLWVVMPNHIHGIIIINAATVETQNFASRSTTPIVETQNFASLPPNDGNRFGPQSKNLASVVRGFKIGVTKYARERGIDFAWQTRYHDHIVRNWNEMNKIADYIENNPARWAIDQLNDSVFADKE
jgi:REP element-mobilizing transposase RayT